MLSRNLEITSFGASVRLHAIHRKGEEPYIESQPWLELPGTATEPVKGVTDVKVSMYPRDTNEIGTARPASVAAIIGARPTLDVGDLAVAGLRPRQAQLRGQRPPEVRAHVFHEAALQRGP